MGGRASWGVGASAVGAVDAAGVGTCCAAVAHCAHADSPTAPRSAAAGAAGAAASAVAASASAAVAEPATAAEPAPVSSPCGGWERAVSGHCRCAPKGLARRKAPAGAAAERAAASPALAAAFVESTTTLGPVLVDAPVERAGAAVRADLEANLPSLPPHGAADPILQRPAPDSRSSSSLDQPLRCGAPSSGMQIMQIRLSRWFAAARARRARRLARAQPLSDRSPIESPIESPSSSCEDSR